jgi:hypothetical protein
MKPREVLSLPSGSPRPRETMRTTAPDARRMGPLFGPHFQKRRPTPDFKIPAKARRCSSKWASIRSKPGGAQPEIIKRQVLERLGSRWRSSYQYEALCDLDKLGRQPLRGNVILAKNTQRGAHLPFIEVQFFLE